MRNGVTKTHKGRHEPNKTVRIRHCESSAPGYVETWFEHKSIIGLGWLPVTSKDLAPVRLPIGQEQALLTALGNFCKRAKP